MAKKKYYVVWIGRNPGVYTSWADCQRETMKFDGAKFKAFPNKNDAEQAFKDGWQKHWGQGAKSTSNQAKIKDAYSGTDEIDYNSISVDVGTRGNPGPVEYKGVDTKTGEELFSYGPISKGTNNLGEFLAIVHGLAYLKENNSNKTIYTDSVNAMKWVREKKVSTTLKRDDTTEEIWDLIDRALVWLERNTYNNKILKWDTKRWGEIKADYGRK